jgi:vacuolar-type H+-ATPase subunit H
VGIEVESHQKVNGDNPREIDEFFDQTGVAVDELMARLHALEGKGNDRIVDSHALDIAAPAAETRGAATRVDRERDAIFDQGTVARALLLAQRTADLVISEAEESARNVCEQAQVRADRIVQEAETRAASVIAEARSAGEAVVTDLERRRSSAERDLALLLEQVQATADRLHLEAETEAATIIAEAQAVAEATIADLERERRSLELGLGALYSRAVQLRDGLGEVLSAQLLAVDGWLTASSDPDMATQESLGPVPGLRPPVRPEVEGEPDAPSADITVKDHAPPT